MSFKDKMLAAPGQFDGVVDGVVKKKTAAPTDWAARSNAAAAYEKRLKAVSDAYAKLADIEDTLAGRDTDPMTKAWADSAKATF